jgi:Cu(I)/Ag(I) efflux system membrane protein CusA/SilA
VRVLDTLVPPTHNHKLPDWFNKKAEFLQGDVRKKKDWVIALAGIDAETGVMMLLYLDLSYDHWKKEGRLKSTEDLVAVIREGAVKRVRPKIMTVMTNFIGLLPIMWAAAHETGADVAKRIAAPLVGGVFTSFMMELLIYPCLYYFLKRRNI